MFVCTLYSGVKGTGHNSKYSLGLRGGLARLSRPSARRCHASVIVTMDKFSVYCAAHLLTLLRLLWTDGVQLILRSMESGSAWATHGGDIPG